MIRRRYKKDVHKVGAALRLASGVVVTGVHIEANVGRIGVCAEAIALGRAATELGDTAVETIVAVIYPRDGSPDGVISVVAPCGMCREMIADYGANAHVIVPTADGGLAKRSIAELLPDKFRRP